MQPGQNSLLPEKALQLEERARQLKEEIGIGLAQVALNDRHGRA